MGAKQVPNGPRLKPPRRRVPILQDPAPLLPRDKLKPPNRNLRRRNRSLQKPNIPPIKRLNAGPIKNIAGVFNHPAQPPRRALRMALPPHAPPPLHSPAPPPTLLPPPPPPPKLHPHPPLLL